MFADFRPGLELSAYETMYPSRLICLGEGVHQFADITKTFFGIVLNGSTRVSTSEGAQLVLTTGMYFALRGGDEMKCDGQVVVFERCGYRGLRTVGGPIEKDGRLCYIDNCRTTIIVHPSRIGDPVLNLLVFPPGIEQTMHLHPTVRLGVVIEGSGVSISPKTPPVELRRGVVFKLDENFLHCFNSGPNGLKIIAYHPDSDTGPTDQDHPMLNRTYIRKG